MSNTPPSGAPSSAQQDAPATSAAATRLYIVAGQPGDADDPLDVIGAAMPVLIARYRDVRWVTPEGAISLRSLRRGMRPGRDRVLFDFTRPSTALWAAETARTLPGGVLCGARRLPLQVTADPSLRRSRRRYSGLLSDFFARGRLAALDVDIPAAGTRLNRPALSLQNVQAVGTKRYACAAICAADGAEESYGALRGWLAARAAAVVSPDAQLLLSVATDNDAVLVERYCQFFGTAAAGMNVDIQCRAQRGDLATIAARSDRLIDLDRFAWTGKTDALAAAESAGIPHVRITSFLSDIATEFQAALTSPPASPSISDTANPPTIAAFSAALVQFIEEAQHADVAHNLRAGAAA